MIWPSQLMSALTGCDGILIKVEVEVFVPNRVKNGLSLVLLSGTA
jgi:hypothetical protein